MSKRMLILIGAVLLVTSAAWACSDTGKLEDDVDQLTQQVDALNQQITTANEAAQSAGIVAAIDAMDTAGLHEIAEGAADGELPEEGTGPVRRAQLAIAAAQWPEELQAGADNLETVLGELIEAVGTGDAAQAAPVADEAHEAQHEFSEAAQNAVAAAAGLPAEEHEEEGATPVATEAQ